MAIASTSVSSAKPGVTVIVEDRDLAYLLQHAVVGLLVAGRHVEAGLSGQERKRENHCQHLKPLEPAAVYQQGLTGNERCALRGEPHDCVGYFIRPPYPFKRRFHSQARFEFRGRDA